MLREIELSAEGSSAEALADALLAAGAWSVTTVDADAGTDRETAIYDEPGSDPGHLAWARSRMAVLIGPDLDPAALVAQACSQAGIPCCDWVERTVAEQDWVRLTQSQFGPVQIGERLWIVPTWSDPPEAAEVVVRLDPGVAFGTGTHPTTRLCLAWLEAHVRPGMRVMDYGCGSGVLSIAAARLGAGRVAGIDIDPQAVAAACNNARLNQVTADYTLAAVGGPDDHRLHAMTAGGFDVVVANILTRPLILLAPVLTALLAPGGRLVLSGILARQAAEVIEAFGSGPRRLDLEVWSTEDGWTCLQGTA